MQLTLGRFDLYYLFCRNQRTNDTVTAHQRQIEIEIRSRDVDVDATVV